MLKFSVLILQISEGIGVRVLVGFLSVLKLNLPVWNYV